MQKKTGILYLLSLAAVDDVIVSGVKQTAATLRMVFSLRVADNWREDVAYVINKCVLERNIFSVREWIQKVKNGDVPGDRLLFATKDCPLQKSVATALENVAGLMNNLCHIFSHRTHMAGYPERFFHCHDARVGILSTIIINNQQ